MLLVIHNLPMNTRFGDVKALLLEKCGLRNLILDKLLVEDNAMQITVGLPTEEDAAILVRKINGLYVMGHQLYVQDMRQKPSEQPYRLPIPPNQQQNRNENQQQKWNNDDQQCWNTNQQQNWNSSDQSWNSNQQRKWNNNEQQGWDDNQSWKNNQQQNWNNQQRNNEPKGNSNSFSNKHTQNAQGFGQDLVTAATLWAQQANTMYGNTSAHNPQNIQYPQQQDDKQGYGGWGNSNQGNYNQGFERGEGDFGNANISWGESSEPRRSRSRSQERRQLDSRHGRSNRSPRQDSREHSRRYSPPHEDRFEHPQTGNKRRWEEHDAHRDDDWRQRPASPPREFRQHHRGRDQGSPQGSGFDSGPKRSRWGDAPIQKFQDSNPRFETPKLKFETPKPRFETPKPRFENPKPMFEDSKPRFDGPKPKIDPKSNFKQKQKQKKAHNQKFNAPNQRFNAPNQRFNAPNQTFNAPNQRFNAPNQRFNAPNQRFNAPNQRFNNPNQNFNAPIPKPKAPKPQFDLNKDNLEAIWDQLTESQQLKVKKQNENFRYRSVKRITFELFNDLGLNQDDSDLKLYFTDPVRSRLNKVLGDKIFDRLDMMYAKFFDAYKNEKQKILEEAQQLQKDGVKPKLQENYKPGEPSNPPPPKRFKADAVKTLPAPIPGKIPSYIDGDKQKFKAIKQQHLQDMKTLRCPDIGPELDKIVDEEVQSFADIFYKVIERSAEEQEKIFLRDRASGECIDDFKQMFKQAICKRLTNEGVKAVRIYSTTGKPPKKRELEPFMSQFGVLALKKSDRKPFFTAHVDTYATLDRLCNMGPVKIGDRTVLFKPLHAAPKFKRIHMSSLKKMRVKYVTDQIKKPEINILDKDWEIKLAAIKEKQKEIQEKAGQEAANKVKAENTNVNVENSNVDAENSNVNVENANVKAENSNVKAGHSDTQVHVNQYGELHDNFNVIDEVQGSDNENDRKNEPKNDIDFTDDVDQIQEKNEPNDVVDFTDDVDQVQEKSDESILRELPVISDHEIIYEDDDENEGDETFAEDIDLDNIDENDLEDY